MKGINLFFCIALALLGFHNAMAEDTDAARSATRRSSATNVVTNRQLNQTSQQTSTNINSGISRSTNTPINSSSQNRSVSTRSSTIVKDGNSRTNTESDTQNVSARSTLPVQTRTTTAANDITSAARTSTTRNNNTISRSAVQMPTNQTTASNSARSAATISRSGTNISRTGTSTQTTKATARKTIDSNNRISRSALTAEEIMNRDYTTCREVYYSCMDEFCANKDSQLKRCACSSRINEFDNIKKQLSNVEEKLLDFNQRLLTVNMDKEDAEALFEATEGELAFQQEDTSESKKLLDEIAKKLNTTFDDSTFNQNLSPISLSLNVDSAFDSVDSMLGASTTAKSGTELYSAALPVCREMALEVCDQEELDIAESGYQMMIEQDCNTVAKTYETQQEKALEQIREGSALLDMSRLDIYQKRNSDDILTCKKKMLDMLTDTSVCGKNLEKCLDISGKYIDPSTGDAILTSDLSNLGNLITRPSGEQSWITMPGNEKFVSYLESKKIFLESATENCQDISDYVWDTFIEDALAQIKLAQESKLEEVRQSCTKLTTQCLSDATESIEDFDSRALSIFGVMADKTVNEMCSEIQNACTALLETTDSGDIWNQGMIGIATNKTYETIMETCREVGRSCIIQACKSISGNFGLCENIETSVNRKSIINRTSCWDEVVECVASAGSESINNIKTELEASILDKDSLSFYNELYGENITLTNNDKKLKDSCIMTQDGNCIYDICEKECGLNEENIYENLTSEKCMVCRLAEKVWGNCEAHPGTELSESASHNKIKIPTNGESTLLSWFAQNTNTLTNKDNCRDTSCGPGFDVAWDAEKGTTICVAAGSKTDDGQICPVDKYWHLNVYTDFTNCCKTENNTQGAKDVFENCCLLSSELSATIDNVDWEATDPYYGAKNPTEITNPNPQQDDVTPQGLCLPEETVFVAATKINKDDYYCSEATGCFIYIFCQGTIDDNATSTPTTTFPNGQELKCSGNYIIVNKTTGLYITPDYNGVQIGTTYPTNFYSEEDTGIQCSANTGWEWAKIENGITTKCDIQDPIRWIIKY